MRPLFTAIFSSVKAGTCGVDHPYGRSGSTDGTTLKDIKSGHTAYLHPFERERPNNEAMDYGPSATAFPQYHGPQKHSEIPQNAIRVSTSWETRRVAP